MFITRQNKVFSIYIMKKEEYNKKLEKLKEELKDEIPDDDTPYYISVKDKKIYVKPTNSKTSNEQFTENLKDTLKDWKKKGYEKYKGRIQDIPSKIYLRFIKKDGRVLNGGVVVKNNVDEKYLYLVGKGYSRFPVQYGDIKDIYYNPNQFKKQKEKQREAERKKEQKQEKENKKVEKEEKITKKEEPKDFKKILSKNEVERKPKKEKITDDEIDKLLNKLYYEDGNTYGRDKLYSIAKKEDDRITRKKVEDWLKNQELYQLTKKSNKNKDFQVLTSKEPFNIIVIDLYTYDDIIILNAIDSFSRKAFSQILKNKSANEVLKGLKKIIKKMDKKPKTIQSDNGSEFKNDKMKKYLEKQEIKQIFSTAGTPQSQGKVERFNGTMKEMLDKYVLQNKKITMRTINKIVKNYNNVKHETLGISPNEALKEENYDKVLNVGSNMKNLKPNKDDLKIGDTVRLALKKDDNKIKKSNINWSEKVYQIHKIYRPTKNKLNPIRYKVEDGDEVLKGVYTRNMLQKINDVENEDKTAVKYEVEKFVGSRLDKNKNIQYKVRWKGYKASEDTWEKAKDLQEDLGKENYKKLVEELKEKLKRKKKK